MDKETLSKYKKAGEISIQAKKLARELLKDGALLVEIADKVEEKIFKLGGRPAFPVNISVNEIAAHYVPAHKESSVLKQGDLVKIDVGVHVDGFIADTAFSYSIGESEENEQLISATNSAVNAAMDFIRPGVPVNEIGRIISGKIMEKGFQPIRNLTGHMVDEYTLHAGLSIPNYDNGDKKIIEEGVVLAVEPFATSGSGIVVEGKNAEVFKLEKTGLLRNGRDILLFIAENYRTLPFAKRWLVREFGLLKTNLMLREAVAKGILKEYKVLREKTGKKVSQAEHTIIVLNNPIIITR